MAKSTKKTTKKSSKKPQNKSHTTMILGILAGVLALILLVVFIIANRPTSPQSDYVFETNAFFAPFEYYDGKDIAGVDMEIISRIEKYMNKTITVKDVEFDVIIDNVASGKLADAGAAGLTVTPARQEKVDFSIPYYDSVQYLIYDRETPPEIRGDHVVWDAVSGSILGSQTGGTGYLFAQSEISEGSLSGTSTEIKGFDFHQLAADAISAHIIDYAIADELPAKMIVAKNPSLAALPLYYSGATIAEDYPVEESYAIAVNKSRPELLSAINAVLTDMLKKDSSGQSEIDRLILKHMGF